MKNKRATPPAGHWLDRWHVDPSANRNYDFIDGLRGLAIVMVLACHSFYAREHQDLASRYFLSFTGTLGRGVDLFFTISGFLIAWPFWKRKAGGTGSLVPPGYGWRRFWKIYPPLALSVLLLTSIYILLGKDPSVFIHAALQWLSGLAFFLPVSGQLNPVMWSLVVEVHFYLALPLLFLLTKPFSARACLWGIPLFMFAVPFAIQVFTGLGPTYAPKISDPFWTGLSCFCFGVAVAGIDALKLWNKRWAHLGDIGWLVLLASLLGLAWWQLDPPAHGRIIVQVLHWSFFLGSGCLLCYAADPEHPRARWLCSPWLRWCGIVSYEWYLFHQPMIMWGRDLLGGAAGNPVKYGLILVVPLIASAAVTAAVYRWFSLPILKYGRSRNRRPT